MPISGLLVASGNMPEVRLLSSAGITRCHQSYKPVRHPRRPSLLLAEFRLRDTTSHRCGFRCCPLLLVDMPSPTTPAKRVEPSSNSVRPVPAFPPSRQGRPSHRAFRGRLGVHTCYGLPTRRRPDAALCLPGFDYIVTSIAAGIATRPGRPLPGQDLHLLEQRTFARHTWTRTGTLVELQRKPVSSIFLVSKP
jgi:hypothetical protein